jgi:hypothetical protein
MSGVKRCSKIVPTDDGRSSFEDADPEVETLPRIAEVADLDRRHTSRREWARREVATSRPRSPHPDRLNACSYASRPPASGTHKAVFFLHEWDDVEVGFEVQSTGDVTPGDRDHPLDLRTDDAIGLGRRRRRMPPPQPDPS